jgi:hypothetical protein
MNDYGAMLTCFKGHKHVIIFTEKTAKHNGLKISDNVLDLESEGFVFQIQIRSHLPS